MGSGTSAPLASGQSSPDTQVQAALTIPEVGQGIWVCNVTTRTRHNNSDEFRPVFSLVLGTRVVVVLSSDVAVKVLLDKRNKIYASRPKSYIRDIATGRLVFGFMVSDGTASEEERYSRQSALRSNVASRTAMVP